MAKHSNIKDGGAVFQIVPNTRKIVVPSSHFVIGTVGEHLSEQITFECPVLIDGHGIVNCDRHYVTWQSADGTIGHDELKCDKVVGGETAIFTWDVRNGLTTTKGVVSFSVHFEDKAEGETVYKFSTTTCKSCEILEAVNATIGKYEAIYVVDDTFVIADYNAVKDNTLALDSDGLIPDGVLKITANGTFDVGEYAGVEVEIADAKPKITVSRDGVVTATTPADTNTHQLSSTDDPNFIAENIKGGVTMFGVDGKSSAVDCVQGSLKFSAIQSAKFHLLGRSANSFLPEYKTYNLARGEEEIPVRPVKSSFIFIKITGDWREISITGNASLIAEYTDSAVVLVTGEGFTIEVG